MRKFLIVFAVIAAAVAMSTNKAGLDLIKEFEGFYANFYRCPAGIKTIGYGHACHGIFIIYYLSLICRYLFLFILVIYYVGKKL